ncbi:MAG: hypothetical protein IKP92_07650, partial [Lachnospiraceae bacterium]|nr:hypothetical protein [Lachnospiraceae bacterium]
MNMFENNKHNDFGSKAPKIMVAESGSKKTVIIVIIAVAAVVLGLAGFITFRVLKANSDVKKKLETASKSMAEQDYDYAINACEEAIAIKRKSEEAYVALGNAYIAKGESLEAAEDLEGAIDCLTKGKARMRDGLKLIQSKTIRERLDKMIEITNRDNELLGREPEPDEEELEEQRLKEEEKKKKLEEEEKVRQEWEQKEEERKQKQEEKKKKDEE